MVKILKILSVGLCMAVFTVGCAQQKGQENQMDQQADQMEEDSIKSDDMGNEGAQAVDISEAVAYVSPTKDSKVVGTVTFTQENDGVRVQANLSGLEEGEHGFHIHKYGDCRADDGSSAGGHFNPAHNDHAGPDADMRHMGDMGNIQAGADGNATIDYVDNTVSINDIIGRAIVVHEGEDDLESQPSGAAGARMACGAIGIANPE